MSWSVTFHVWWVVAFVLLVLFAAAIGSRTDLAKQYKLKGLGILVDDRGRFSLTHFQIVLWTLVILSSLVGAFVSQNFDAASLRLSSELLGLMGISLGSTVLATGVKSAKDASGAKIARAGMKELPGGQKVMRDGKEDELRPHFAQIWLEEEGGQAEKVVNVSKFQSLIFTLVIVVYYVAAAWKVGGIPDLPQDVVWLIGISHAGYVGGKIPNRP